MSSGLHRRARRRPWSARPAQADHRGNGREEEREGRQGHDGPHALGPGRQQSRGIRSVGVRRNRRPLGRAKSDPSWSQLDQRGDQISDPTLLRGWYGDAGGRSAELSTESAERHGKRTGAKREVRNDEIAQPYSGGNLQGAWDPVGELQGDKRWCRKAIRPKARFGCSRRAACRFDRALLSVFSVLSVDKIFVPAVWTCAVDQPRVAGLYTLQIELSFVCCSRAFRGAHVLRRVADRPKEAARPSEGIVDPPQGQADEHSH